MNNELNRFFAHANKYFMWLTKDDTNADLLASIDGMMHEEDISPWNHCKIYFNRMNERFRIPYIYAKMILDNQFMLSGNGFNNMALIFDMNILFERFFAQFICRNKKKIFENQTPQIRVQEVNNNFIYDSSGKVIRLTKPDLILCFNERRYIFDTKYKKLDEPQIDRPKDRYDKVHSIAQSDLYQMYTYSQIYNSQDTILVFPGFDSKLSKPYSFTKNDNKKLWIYMFKLNLNGDNWESNLVHRFKEDFQKII